MKTINKKFLGFVSGASSCTGWNTIGPSNCVNTQDTDFCKLRSDYVYNYKNLRDQLFMKHISTGVENYKDLITNDLFKTHSTSLATIIEDCNLGKLSSGHFNNSFEDDMYIFATEYTS